MISKQRRVALVLATATVMPIAALGWLGVRALQQERAAERQQRRERLEVAAGRLALDLDRHLRTIERDVVAGRGVRLGAAGIASADLPMLFQPATPEPTPFASAEFTRAEIAEFQRHDLNTAADAYRHVAETSTETTRAAALAGLARVRRLSGDWKGALDAYSQLERLGVVRIADQPAGLVARQGRCKVFEESSDAASLHQETADLAHTLYAGGWPIDRATFELYRDLLTRWGAERPPRASLVTTEAAIQLWRLWRAGDLPSAGRRLLRTDDDAAVLATWSTGADQLVASIERPDDLEQILTASPAARGVEAAIYDADGRLVAGHAVAGGLSVNPADTRLPFIVTVSAAAGFDDRGRRGPSLLVGGLLVAFTLMLAAAVVLYRTTMREMAIARQQSDFVSAVSHEFRTPLTSMRHLTELLASGAVSSAERKAQYYELLSQETERLHRLVEGLLGFGRMEAGAYAWQLEPTDVRDLLERGAEEFRREPLARGREVVCESEADLPLLTVDRDALSRALWNLLENAAKYSPAGAPIRLFARRDGASVRLGVGDQGVGIPAAEREAVFQTFVRGADAKRSGVGGVGIGLALVQRIAHAHGGTVQIESEPGRGSTLTLVIPCPGS